MIENILIVGGIGSVIFTLIIILLSTTGIAKAMRDEEGKFKKEFNRKTLLGAVVFIGFLTGLLHYGNLNYTNTLNANPTFFQLWVNYFGIFLIIHLFDLIILDYIIIVKWHPAFLKLPDTQYCKTMQLHINGFFKGGPLWNCCLFNSFVIVNDKYLIDRILIY